MKTRKISAAILVLIMAFCLSGCGTFNMDTDAMISPPELTGDMYPIAQALSKSIKGEYQLKYPSLGDRRSAIMLEDIDDDGVKEAFAFYSTAEDETTNMHINIISRNGKGYKSVADMAIVAGGVERVDFCDLDGDNKEEIIVGWEIYGSSEKQICVYSLDGSQAAQLLAEKYTGFICCSIASEGNQLLIQQLNTSEMNNTAVLYAGSDNGLKKIGSCMLDPEVKTVSSIAQSQLATGNNAVYIDEIKGAGAVTEVLIFENGELKNPLLNIEGNIENISTLRAATIQSKDIDGDGSLEIPVATNLPNAAGGEELLYYTNWCAFDGENLITRQIMIVNTIDGYCINIPDDLAGRIAVLKDTENHRRVIYRYNAETGEAGDRLATVSVISKKQWDKKGFDRMSMFELARNDEFVFVGAVNLAAEKPISEKQLKEMFLLD